MPTKEAKPAVLWIVTQEPKRSPFASRSAIAIVSAASRSEAIRLSGFVADPMLKSPRAVEVADGLRMFV